MEAKTGVLKVLGSVRVGRYENDSANISGYEPSSSDTLSTDTHRSGILCFKGSGYLIIHGYTTMS